MTVEGAIVLCSLVMVTALCMSAVLAVGTHIRCIDAAREAVRLAARDDPRASDVGLIKAPSGATIRIHIGSDTHRAEVQCMWMGIDLGADAVAVTEPKSQ